MSFLAELRLSRVAPLLNDPRLRRVIEGLKRDEFLKGTVIEARARAAGMDPYSFAIGFAVGSVATVIVGMVTIEFWLPRALARVVGKSLEETSREVSKWLATTPVAPLII